jgi:hypothetical protein
MELIPNSPAMLVIGVLASFFLVLMDGSHTTRRGARLVVAAELIGEEQAIADKAPNLRFAASHVFASRFKTSL